MIPSDLQPTLWLLQPVHRNTDSTGHQQVPLFYEGLGNDTIVYQPLAYTLNQVLLSSVYEPFKDVLGSQDKSIRTCNRVLAREYLHQ